MNDPRLSDGNQGSDQSWRTPPSPAPVVDDDERMVVLLAWGFLRDLADRQRRGHTS